MTMRFFIFGAGYSGRAIAELALSQGHHAAGTTRSAEKTDMLRKAGIEPLVFDGSTISQDIDAALSSTTHLVVSIAPGESDPVLAVARDTIVSRMPALRWIGYLSTVGVYGDHKGAWVDEDAACGPSAQRSQQRLDAEQAWLSLGKEIGRPVAILRLSGIYGPGRNAFVNIERGTARRIIKENQIFNRIHVDDIAGAAMHLAMSNRGGIFNVTDDEPAPPQDVVEYAASLMGAALPQAIPFEEAEMTPMARSFYGENKRVSNARIKGEGYVFRFPDYRSAFDHMWKSGIWRG